MKVTVSTAVSADGYLDDRSPDRLILSTPGRRESPPRQKAGRGEAETRSYSSIFSLSRSVALWHFIDRSTGRNRFCKDNKMMAIARIGTYRLPNRLLSSAKIRLSRGQKQIYLCFAEAEYLRRSQRLGLSRGQKQIYLYFAEAKYLRRSQRLRLGRGQKQILFASCRSGVLQR